MTGPVRTNANCFYLVAFNTNDWNPDQVFMHVCALALFAGALMGSSIFHKDSDGAFLLPTPPCHQALPTERHLETGISASHSF